MAITRQTGKGGQSRFRKRKPNKHTEVSNSLINLRNFKQFNMDEMEDSRSDLIRMKSQRKERRAQVLFYDMKLFDFIL